MPVITRSQSRAKQLQKQQQLTASVQEKNLNTIIYNIKKKSFIDTALKTCYAGSKALELHDKIIAATTLLALVNADYDYLFNKSKIYDVEPDIWNNYTVVIYNKLHEYRNSHMQAKGWPAINQNIVTELINNINTCEKIINKIIMQIDPKTMLTDKNKNDLINAQKKLYIRTSPRKNIKRINYSQFY